jgi:hypothetical protein
VVTKKTRTSKEPSRPKGRPARADAPGAAPADDPQGQAQFCMQLLDGLKHESGPEASRLRIEIISAIGEYQEARERGEDVGRILEATKQKLTLVEASAAGLMLRWTKRMRDRLLGETRRLGTTSPGAQAVRGAAEGLDLIVGALTKVIEAANEGDALKRQQAHALLAQARAAMAPLIQ